MLFRCFKRLVDTVQTTSLILFLCASLACGADRGKKEDSGELLVFAAASTADVMNRLAEKYEDQTGIRVKCSFAASSTLARQIEAGAPADILLSANEEWMDRLERSGVIESGSRRDLLGNELVLIAPFDRPFHLEMIPGAPIAGAFEGRLAMGDPAHVPAGRYAREALEFMGWWPGLEERLIPAMDARDALRLVALGESGAGVVYATDAAGRKDVVVIGTFPRESHTPIRYPLARIKGASKLAGGFIEFLFSDAAAEVFEAAAFKWGISA